MNITDIEKEQRDRLINVIEYLKGKGFSQNEIAEKSDFDNTKLSHLKSGKIKKIPEILLNKLYENFNINPEYIRLESDIMIDIPGMKYANFEKFVNSWNVIAKENSNEKYLHLEMDRNFYDFLIEAKTIKFLTDEGVSSYSEEIEHLKKLFSGNAKNEEFVLLPRNCFIEIVENTIEKYKNFTEIINPLEHQHYIDN